MKGSMNSPASCCPLGLSSFYPLPGAAAPSTPSLPPPSDWGSPAPLAGAWVWEGLGAHAPQHLRAGPGINCPCFEQAVPWDTSWAIW